jgi:anaerobic selenocysteine-containing dehydrogenase
MGIVSDSRGVVPPASSALRSEVAIVAGVAAALFPDEPAWAAMAARYDLIRDHIAAVVPGFEGFNQRIRSGSFALPNDPRRGVFGTASGRAELSAEPVVDAQQESDELAMMTLRSHDQFNTTVYGLDDRYRGIEGGRRVIFMHEEDVAARGLRAGELVDLTSDFGGVRRSAPAFRVVPYPIPRGQAATYFPETNVLVPIDSVAEQSNTPSSKYVRIRVHARSAESAASAR